MIIERDVPVPCDDGLLLRADVFRPDHGRPVPVIMTLGPYGKGVEYKDWYAAQWSWLLRTYPEILPGSTRAFMTWETVDPETWVPWDYAVVRVDSRGAGRSPGVLDIFSPREVRDYYNAIEWAGTQPWSNGKVGLNGISYYAVNQWLVASLQPPHLAAMIPWEGAADFYRDWARHGGIASNAFLEAWYPRQVVAVQHGNAAGPRDPWQNESATGPQRFSAPELAANRRDPLPEILARPLDDAFYRERSPDWSKVTVPFLSAANWAGRLRPLAPRTREIARRPCSPAGRRSTRARTIRHICFCRSSRGAEHERRTRSTPRCRRGQARDLQPARRASA